MSLINEALKKAQRQRAEEAAQVAAPMPGGGGAPIAKRGQARSANTMVLLAGGAVALIVLSVVATVFLVNRPAAKAPAVAAAAQPVSPPAPDTSPAPSIVAPTLKVPEPSPPAAPISSPPTPTARSAAPASATPPVPPAKEPVASPANATANMPPPSASGIENKPAVPAPPAETPAVAAVPATAVAGKFDERVHAYVEAIRVTAIRPLGNESRVMMNDRVYRLNDIVERTLQIRLIKVATDSLTFSDANGVTYVKYF